MLGTRTVLVRIGARFNLPSERTLSRFALSADEDVRVPGKMASSDCTTTDYCEDDEDRVNW